MTKNFLLIGITVFTVLALGIINNQNKQVQESITYFPIDPKVTFISTDTTLNILKRKQADKYIVNWNLRSVLDRKAYLRQDIGLLFFNGKLVAKQGKWKQNTEVLNQERQIVKRGNGILQAITFHHAELHENNNQILSAQKMSGDQMYVVQLNNGTVHNFRNVISNQESEWKRILDQQAQSYLHHSWGKGIRYFSINPNQYDSFPLTDLFFNSSDSLLGFTKQESNKILGNLWEGLYKNYFLGIKKAGGTKISPIGSTIPLILIARDKTHLLVLTETENGEPTLLRQMIEYEHSPH